MSVQRAAKCIEEEGVEGFDEAQDIVGYEYALVLITAHLRRAYGSMEGFPPDPAIDQKVWADLTQYIPGVEVLE